MNIFRVVGKPFTALAGKVDHTVQTKILMSLVRHCVTAAGAALVAKGVLASGVEPKFIDAATELIGLMLAGTGVASAVVQKVDEHTL